MHLRIFACTLNTLIFSFEYMDWMMVSVTLKNFRFLLRSCLFTEHVLVIKMTCSTFQSWHCIASLNAFRRDTYWSSVVCLTLVRYRSQTSDIHLCSRMQETPMIFPTGGRTVIPSGRNRQNLSFVITSLDRPSRALLDSACVRGRSISQVLVTFHMTSCVRFKYRRTSISDGMSFHSVWRHFSSKM